MTARDDESDIIRWLRLTPPRPAVDPERAARVREVVQEAWREAVRQRRRRRQEWWTAAAALALLSTWGVWMLRPREVAVPPVGSPVAVVLAATPSPTASGESGRPMRVGEVIVSGARVTTQTALTVSLLESPVRIRVDADTDLRFDAPRVLFVERGRVYVETGSGSERAIEVRTPHGTVLDVGTRFEVRTSDDGLRVRVREGRVNVTRGHESRDLGQGTELMVTSREIAERVFATFDADWGWITRAGVPFVLEGQSLASFLEWVSAESGWTIHFADDRTRRDTRDTVLHGSIAGLSPAEAMDVVLPTCGLDYRVDGGVVTIEAASNRSRGLR